MPTLFARGSDGTVAIYTGASDVVDNPLGDLSRVLFHSDLEYPAIVSEHDITVPLPSRSGGSSYNAFNLFGHGKAGTPFVLGYIANLANVPLAGSVPIATNDTLYGRFVTLGADATWVILHDASIMPVTGSYAAQTLDLKIFVTDLLLT